MQNPNTFKPLLSQAGAIEPQQSDENPLLTYMWLPANGETPQKWVLANKKQLVKVSTSNILHFSAGCSLLHFKSDFRPKQVTSSSRGNL